MFLQMFAVASTIALGPGVRGWLDDPAAAKLPLPYETRRDWSAYGPHEDMFARSDFAALSLKVFSVGGEGVARNAKLRVTANGETVVRACLWLEHRNASCRLVAEGTAKIAGGTWSDVSVDFADAKTPILPGDRLWLSLTGARDGKGNVRKCKVDAERSSVSFYVDPVAAESGTGLRAAPVVDCSTPDDRWAGLTRHPAVVNPPIPEDPAKILSLNGEWTFSAKAYSNGDRVQAFQHQATWADERKIVVPGCWEAQGVGEPHPTGIQYSCSDRTPRALNHFFNGAGWYRREVTVPAGWKGKRIWFKTGGTRGRGKFWVNGNPVCRLDDYTGTWKFDVTPYVKPGERAQVVAEVVNVFPNRNVEIDCHNRWGGIWREVAFEATETDCWIDDCWVRGDFDDRKAIVNVEVGRVEKVERVEKLRVTVDGVAVDRTIEQSNNQAISVDLSSDFRPWSPEEPNLYTAKVELVGVDGKVLETRWERFGVRKLEVRGNRFYLNDRPLFVRGCGDDSNYPLTGLSPADRAFHLRHLRKLRQAGFNFIRLHTHAEIDEYFQAADEAGLLLQPELSYYQDECMDVFGYSPERDVKQMHLQFRRHPSFAVYCTGNEGTLGSAAADKWFYDYVKALDPDRLVINQDGGRDNRPGTADFRSGPLGVWQRGSFEPGQPFICHEYQNLTVKADPRKMSRYTGVFAPPTTMAQRLQWLGRKKIGAEWVDLLQTAQHALQAYWQKDGSEMARLDPFCDGYCYWTAVAVVGFNPAGETATSQGFLDSFWETKEGGNSLDEFAKFNSPTCLLIDGTGRACEHDALSFNNLLFDMPGEKATKHRTDLKRVYSEGETLRAKVFLSHYGRKPLRDAKVAWSLGDLARGEFRIDAFALGELRALGEVAVAVPKLERAEKAELAMTLLDGDGSTVTENHWTYYLFPKRAPERVSRVACVEAYFDRLAPRYPGLARFDEKSAPDFTAYDTVIVQGASGLEEIALKAGVNVVALSNQLGEPNIHLGWWCAGEQVGTAFKRSEIFRHLPFEPYLCPLYFRIMKVGTRFPRANSTSWDFDVRADELVAVGESATEAYYYLTDRRLPNGRRYVRISGLDVVSDTPEGTAILDGVIGSRTH